MGKTDLLFIAVLLFGCFFNAKSQTAIYIWENGNNSAILPDNPIMGLNGKILSDEKYPDPVGVSGLKAGNYFMIIRDGAQRPGTFKFVKQ